MKISQGQDFLCRFVGQSRTCPRKWVRRQNGLPHIVHPVGSGAVIMKAATLENK